MEPKVLVITRTKNRPLLLKRAIQSVQSQTFRDYLHVIVNDGGNVDCVNNLVASSKSPHIQVIHHQQSLGMESASNVGVCAIKSDYVVIHDDDDSWQPTFLERAVAFLDTNKSYSGVVCNINQIFEVANDQGVATISKRLFNPAVRQFNRSDFFVANQFVPIAFLYRYELHEKVGMYNEELRVCGDLDYYLRVLRISKIGKIEQALANYHIRTDKHMGEPLSNSVSDKNAHHEYAAKVLAYHDDRSLFEKALSYLRVKLWYRGLNVVIRRMQTR